MGKFVINFLDVLTQIINNQQIVKAATVTEADSSSVYFITSVFGTSIAINDADGNNVITSASSSNFFVPLRFERGFTVTGTNLSVVYSKVEMNINL